MARKKKQSVNWRSINNRLDSIDLQMQDAYKTTYNSTQANNMNLKNISDDIMGAIDALVADDSDIQGIPDISRLYNRLKTKEGNSSFSKDIFDIFNDKSMINNLMDVYSKSRSIRQMDDQIDMVCKYMPKLQNALDILKDSVLVSETFSKDYLNLISGLNKDDDAFATRAIALKNKYDLENLFDTISGRTSKYGECFVYIVPYKKAFEQILMKRNRTPRSQMPSMMSHESVIIESGSFVENGGLLVNSNAPRLSDGANGKFTLNFRVGTIDEVVNEYDTIDKLRHKIPKGLYEQFIEENALLNESTDKENKTTTADTKIGKDSVKFNQLIPDELKYEPLDSTANDGLVDPTKNDRKPNITTPGCIVKILERDKVFPIYIEDSCIGYYYLEYVSPGYTDSTSLFKNSIVGNQAVKDSMEADAKNDKVLKYLAAQISKNLDAAFINANIDLSKEIYMILKYDEKFNAADPSGNFNAAFIPAEDIHHHYYKMDPKTHRGVSDLYDGLIPATIWCMLSLCTSVGIVTRGQDKRVYYVQQTGLETNVAKTLMNVVNQIKRGNFGVRQLESINNILGIVGKYNDYVIPTGPNGEAPVRFEMMQGQQIEAPTEMMQTMEENAINSTGVPLELVNATKGLDYAVHYTVSNSRFMTIVTKRQGKEQKMESKMCTKIYNCEYEENTLINIMLPEPRFISTGNTNSVIDNVRQYAQNITEIYGYDLDDTEKAEFTNLIMRNRLASHINCDMIDNLKSLSRVNVAAKTQPEQEQ